MGSARALSAVLAFGLCAGACGPPTPPVRDEAALLQTSALRYEVSKDEIGYRTRIPWAFHNTTADTVWIPNCDRDVRPLLQVQRNESWFDAWTPFRDLCVSPAVVVAPGETFADTLDLFGAPAGSNVTPAFAFEQIEGTYRLLWDRALTRYDGEHIDPEALLPPSQRVSNAFLLVP